MLRQTLMALAAAVPVSGCGEHLAQMHREYAGAPSPAVAMYAAQVRFAGSVCDVADNKAEQRFQTDSLGNGLRVQGYERDYAEFRQALGSSGQKYAAHWRGMDQGGKARFCGAYTADVASITQGYYGPHRVTARAENMRLFFSPPSKPAVDRQTRVNVALAVLSVAAIAGGVAQTDNGNFDGAADLSDASRTLSDGMTSQRAAAACPAYGTFLRHGDALGAPVWGSYTSIASCP